ncbi:quinol monooxygenase YgiN [Arthrobacter sp. CAN_A214]|uniref:putative quinol monooxygenase n=1 Tax=Arthrobacter sp. CAN_A214 TaxID=2787720 RepID=UPI0018C93EEA
MSKPVDVLAVFTPNEGEFFRVKLALEIAVERVTEEPGCIQYEITDAAQDRIVLTEKWESTELLDLHLGGPAVQDLGESLSALLARPAEVTRSDKHS